MTSEQKAAFVVARAVHVLVSAMGMQAENVQRQHRGESIAFPGTSFDSLLIENPLDSIWLKRFFEKTESDAKLRTPIPEPPDNTTK